MRAVPLGTVTEVALPLQVASAGMLARQFTPAESQTCFTRARAGAPALALVKQVWDSAGVNCLASIPADATCNGSATSVTVPSGTALMMLIYVRNTNGAAVTDVRFQDLLDDSATGFTYTASSIKQTPNDGTT